MLQRLRFLSLIQFRARLPLVDNAIEQLQILSVDREEPVEDSESIGLERIFTTFKQHLYLIAFPESEPPGSIQEPVNKKQKTSLGNFATDDVDVTEAQTKGARSRTGGVKSLSRPEGAADDATKETVAGHHASDGLELSVHAEQHSMFTLSSPGNAIHSAAHLAQMCAEEAIRNLPRNPLCKLSWQLQQEHDANLLLNDEPEQDVSADGTERQANDRNNNMLGYGLTASDKHNCHTSGGSGLKCDRPNYLTPKDLKTHWLKEEFISVTSVTCFSQCQGEFACFSNFYQFNPIAFQVPSWCNKLAPRKVLVNTSEKMLMLIKSAYFRDQQSFDTISTSSNPGAIKKLGRQVRFFQEDVWMEIVCAVAEYIVYEKFSANVAFRDTLLRTNSDLLAEASKWDNLWGIGVESDNIASKHPHTWKGFNVLGFALMQCRRRFAVELGSVIPHLLLPEGGRQKQPADYIIDGSDLNMVQLAQPRHSDKEGSFIRDNVQPSSSIASSPAPHISHGTLGKRSAPDEPHCNTHRVDSTGDNLTKTNLEGRSSQPSRAFRDADDATVNHPRGRGRHMLQPAWKSGSNYRSLRDALAADSRHDGERDINRSLAYTRHQPSSDICNS